MSYINPMKVIDLRSDTVTRPNPEMRRAMAEAQVGDDVFGDDPSVNELQTYVAQLFEKESALYVPSGTMSNQIALKVHTLQRGQELLCDRECHIVNYEVAGPVVHAGLLVNLITTEFGMISAATVRDNIRIKSLHTPETRIVALENTHNRHGGTILPQQEILAVRQVCSEHGLIFHLDGARIWNAHVATGLALAELAEPFDSVSVCLSKGLGAPVGSLILGSHDFIQKCLRERKLFGGGMRQAGILAAAGLYALKHNIARLSEDHVNAKWLAMELNELGFLQVDMNKVQTNIVVAKITDGRQPATLLEWLKTQGVLAVPFGRDKVRFVTHLDAPKSLCEEAIWRIRKAAA